MMRKRRRASRGPEKTKVMHFRVQPLTLKAVEDAAKASGRTVSAECEAQLQRALFGMCGGLYPILQIVSDNLNKIVELKTGRWADNPALFDRAFNAIVAMIEMCRPSGSIFREATDAEIQQARNLMLNSFIQIHGADSSARFASLNLEQRRLVKLKDEMGAIGAEPLLRRFAMLVQKASTTESPTEADTEEMWRLLRVFKSSAESLTISSPVIDAPTVKEERQMSPKY
jgi:hypothetical protein